MNKIVSIKTTSAIFLAIVLVAGTITMASPSFIVGAAQASSDREKNHDKDDDRKSYKKDRDRDENYESRAEDYGNDDKKDYDRKSYEKDNYYDESQYKSSYKQDYKPTEYSSYGKPYYQPEYKPAYSSYDKKDNNNIYKSTKDSSSKNVDIKKIKCNNINVNINNGQGGTGNGDNRNTTNGNSSTAGNETNNGNKKFNKDNFAFVCINNNNNEQIIPPTPPTPPTPPVNNVCTVWRDDTPGNPDIFFARSTDGGQTFSEPDNISENTGFSTSPQVICEGNNVYVVWQDDTPGNEDIFFTRSTDGGLTFSEPDNLSENTGGSFVPQISSEGNNVYVVWTDLTPGNTDIFFTRSTDGGQTFSEPPDNISENAGESFVPQISSEGNNVYVVWTDLTPGNTDIFFARSTDGGQTFSDPPDNISENAGISTSPQISSEGENVYVVWQDDTPGNFPGNFDIFFARSTDGGQTFSEPDNLSENAGSSSNSQISSEGDNVYVVWDDLTPGNTDIFFARSTDGGQTFSEPDNLSKNAGDSNSSQISSEGDNVYVVWQDDTPGNEDIFFARSTDGGQTFSEPDNISENAGGSFESQISSEGENVYVVWQDDTPGNSDILFARSTDGGQTFSDPPDNISENTGGSDQPQISSSTS